MKFLKNVMLASLIILISTNLQAQNQSKQQNTKTNTTSIETQQFDQNLEYYMPIAGLKALIAIASFIPYYFINKCPQRK